MYQKIAISILCVSTISCANNPFHSYHDENKTTIRKLSQGNTQEVLKECPGDNVINYMQCGSTNRFVSDYKSSNNCFTDANNYVDVWAKSFHNKTGGAAMDALQAGLLNDAAVDYQVKDYEKVMLSSYRAMNLMNQNDYDNARVEIKRMYQLEQVIKNYRDALYAKTEQDSKNVDKNAPSLAKFEQANANKYDFTSLSSPQVLALKNGYQSAFSHYLAGYLFEALGEPDLARPGYVNSYKIMPSKLSGDAVNNLDKNVKLPPKTTDLLIIEEVGHAPIIKSVSLNVPYIFSQGSCVGAVSIAFPELQYDKSDYPVNTIKVNNSSAGFELLTDVNLMAQRTLNDNIPNIFINNMIRVARDVVAQQAACRSGNIFVSLGTTIGTAVLSSHADERTWSLLPSKFYVTRVKVPYGTTTLKFSSQSGEHTYQVATNKPYQMVAFRILGNQVYFNQTR